ncbi:MAG: hypothetical protein IPO81_04245 [Kouleothrix sp.]|nr:hypothetical protein [Kouleothrix sp.]
MSVQRQRINDFAELRSVAGFIRGFERPWYRRGWAIDLFLGYQTRPHKDIEIAIFRSDQRALYEHLAGWQAEQVVESRRQPWRGEWLAPPVHEIHARRPHGNPGQLEILLDEREGDLWRFRRNPAIVLPVALLGVRSSLGVPLLAPEVALLYSQVRPARGRRRFRQRAGPARRHAAPLARTGAADLPRPPVARAPLVNIHTRLFEKLHDIIDQIRNT